MPRYEPPQHYDERLANGTLTFYKSGTNSLATIYADSTELTAIANPVTLGANGEEPNIFYSGSTRVVAKASDGSQIFDRDPVGGESTFGNFGLFDAVIVYSVNDLVQALNGKFYKSITNDNQGNDPTLSAGTSPSWEEVRFLGIWNSTVSYSTGTVAQTSDGQLWRSLVDANLANNPSADTGTNWKPAVDASKLDEITKVLILTGGGALTALRTNEIHDGSAYTLPAASTVQLAQQIALSLPERYRAFEPIITASGADTITDSVGTNSDIVYNATSFGLIYLTSDGVSNWTI